MIRTAWFVANLFLWTGFYASIAVTAGLLGVRNKPGGVYDWCAREWAVRLLWAAGVRVRVVGLDRVPAGRPVVFVSNHQSWFDIFALLAVIPWQMRFVAKKELAKVPFLGRAMHSAGHIFIDRQNRQAAFSAYDEAAKAIRGGMCATVFAEGTRSRTGTLQPFKKGPFVLALAAQVPIIPVYCAGTFDLLPKGTVRVNPHPIALLFGEPMPTEGLGYDDREAVMVETRGKIEELRERSREVLGKQGT